jgi:hypothetical protein
MLKLGKRNHCGCYHHQVWSWFWLISLILSVFIRPFVFIEKQIQRKMIRTKNNAKTNEELDIQRIIERLSSGGTDVSESKLLRAFTEQMGGEEHIVRAYSTQGKKGTKSGDRKTHYDFCVDTNQRTGLRVEHKGSTENKPIDPTMKPWHLGVQWHNGSPKYQVLYKYLRAWYDYWIGSERLSEKYQIVAPIPAFDVWMKKDAMVQGNPTSPYGKELKQKARERNGDKSSLMEERDEFIAQGGFSQTSLTAEDLEELKQGVLETANRCLQEKDLWIQIAGNLHGDSEDAFQVQWSPKCAMMTEIVGVEMSVKKNVEFVFTCADGFRILGIMRWGKGQGFSNFRFDLK